MRARLGSLPIRWQITILHATILTLVLAGAGGLLYVQERNFLVANAAAGLRAQARGLLETQVGSLPPVPPRPARLPRRAPASAPDRALMERLPALAHDLAARNTGAVILALDGTPLAQADLGPPTPAPDSGALARAAAGAENERFVGSVGQERLLATLTPLWQAGHVVAVVELSTPLRPIDDALDRLARYLLAGWGLAVGAATALGVSATRRVLQPLEHVARTTRRIAAGNLHQRVGLPAGQNEIAQLGAAFDAMVARLEAAFTAQRRFVADAAHELRTPLTALSASTELLLIGADEANPVKTQRLLHHLDTELNRVIRLTNDLLTLSTLDAQPQLSLHPLELSPLLQDLCEQHRALLHDQTLQCDIAPGLWVNGHPDRLRQVVLNVLDNARKYTPPGGALTVHAARDGREVCVLVQDSGIGIPADALAHLFQRFFRVDSARTRGRGGSGLGLAIVQALMVAHGGRVRVDSSPNSGTSVRLYLPLLDPSVHPHRAPASAPATGETT